MPTRATRYKPCRQTGRSERAREGAVDSKALCRQEERVVVTLYTLYDIILYHIMLCYIILYYIMVPWLPARQCCGRFPSKADRDSESERPWFGTRAGRFAEAVIQVSGTSGLLSKPLLIFEDLTIQYFITLWEPTNFRGYCHYSVHVEIPHPCINFSVEVEVMILDFYIQTQSTGPWVSPRQRAVSEFLDPGFLVARIVTVWSAPLADCISLLLLSLITLADC